VSFKVIMS